MSSLLCRTATVAMLAWSACAIADADQAHAVDARAEPASLAVGTDARGPNVPFDLTRATEGMAPEPEPAGRYPLHAAALNDQVELANALIDSGVPVDARDAAGRTPLMVATAFGNAAMAEALLTRGANPLAKDEGHGATALHFAAVVGKVEVARRLLEHGARLDARAGHNGETPLHYAAVFGHLQMIELLIGRGADPNVADNSGITPLQYATRRLRAPAVALLLRFGARQDNLFDAVNANDVARVQKLLAGGSRANELGLAGTPLHLAVSKGHVAIALMLIDAGAELEAPGEPAGAHPLHAAALSNQASAAMLLIDRGAQIEARDDQGRTPLIVAAEFGNAKVAEALIDQGADLQVRDSIYGDTPLHWAACSGDVDTADVFLSRGADVNSRSDHDGETPLNYTAAMGHVDMIEFLAASGADLDATDNTGTTPLRYSMRKNLTPAMTLLRGLGAKE